MTAALSPADLSSVIYLALFLVLLVGVMCCIDTLSSLDTQEHAWSDGQKTLARANRDFVVRPRLKKVKE